MSLVIQRMRQWSGVKFRPPNTQSACHIHVCLIVSRNRFSKKTLCTEIRMLMPENIKFIHS